MKLRNREERYRKSKNNNSDEAGYIPPSGNRREVGLPAALVSSPIPPAVSGKAWTRVIYMIARRRRC